MASSKTKVKNTVNSKKDNGKGGSTGKSNSYKRYKARTLSENGTETAIPGRSAKLPKPNIIRIESLPYQARSRFIGGYAKALDKFRGTLQDEAGELRPFYGFVDPQSLKFGVKSDWSQANDACGFNMLGNMLQSAGNVVGKIPGATRVGSAISKAGGITNGIMDLGKTGTVAGVDMYSKLGINTTFTGTATMKELKGVGMSLEIPITCKWYMPEQGDLCRMSIARLMKLAYVREPGSMESIRASIRDAIGAISGINDEVINTAVSPMVDTIMYGGAGMISSVGNSVANAFMGSDEPLMGSDTTGMDRDYDDSVEKNNNANKTWADEAVDFVKEGATKVVQDTNRAATDTMRAAAIPAAAGAVNMANLLGAHFTVNPAPVRVCIGHILDIEPCVITNVTIESSKEQFIDKDGSHIPLFVSAHITIDFWMNPSPGMDFFQFMGDELFTGTNYQI